MFIPIWTYAILVLFKYQYSYDAYKSPFNKSYIDVTNNGTLMTCIYPGDKSFKKGSPTLPRAELRSIEEWGNPFYRLAFNVSVIKEPKGTDYSVFQVFGGGSPLLMIRHRKGRKEMVVFDGLPKIQAITTWPKSCIVDCKAKQVDCDGWQSKGQLDCSSLYFKVGVYAQGQKPKDKMCIEYGAIKYGML